MNLIINLSKNEYKPKENEEVISYNYIEELTGLIKGEISVEETVQGLDQQAFERLHDKAEEIENILFSADIQDCITFVQTHGTINVHLGQEIPQDVQTKIRNSDFQYCDGFTN